MTARIIQPAEAPSSVPLTRLRGVTPRLHAVTLHLREATLHLREAIRRHRIVLLLRVPIRRRAILPHQATLPVADLTVEQTAAATRAARLTAADHL
jgi:hypothetical protein